MIEDPIVAEVRKYREEHATIFGHDLKRIVAALRERGRKSERPVLNPGPKYLSLPAMESEAKAGSPRKASAQACRRRGAGAAGPGAVEAVCRAHPTRRRAIRRRVMA